MCTYNFVIFYVLRMHNAQEKEGFTPAMIAAKKQNQGALRFLVAKNADLTIIDNKRNNVFHYAAVAGKDIIEVNMMAK